MAVEGNSKARRPAVFPVALLLFVFFLSLSVSCSRSICLQSTAAVLAGVGGETTTVRDFHKHKHSDAANE